MKNQKGYVGWSGSRSFKGRVLWSFRLKEVDAFFGCGETDPRVNKGDYIEFDYAEENGGYSVIPGSVKRVELATAPVSGAALKANVQKDHKNQSGYWDERLSRDIANDEYRKENDIRIQYQSARNAAIEWVSVLVSKDLVKLPEKNGKSVLDGLLADYTNKFFDATANITEVVKTENTEIPFDKEVA